MPPLPPMVAAVAAPAVTAVVPAVAAPAASAEPICAPVAMAFCKMIGAAMVLKISQMPSTATPIRFCNV